MNVFNGAVVVEVGHRKEKNKTTTRHHDCASSEASSKVPKYAGLVPEWPEPRTAVVKTEC